MATRRKFFHFQLIQVKPGNPNIPPAFKCWQFLDSNVFEITSSAKPPLNGFKSSKKQHKEPGSTQ